MGTEGGCCLHRLPLTAALSGRDGTPAAVLTEGCAGGSNLTPANSVEKDLVLKAFSKVYVHAVGTC